MNQQSSSKLTYKGVSVLPLILIIPLILLAGSQHWAFDESWSFVSVLDLTPTQIIAYDQFNLANNHVLNSLYFYLLQRMGVNLMLLYRLPALLAFFLYFYFVSKLLKLHKGYQLRHIDQLMLYLWPYFIYFAQGRGYGPAMAAFAGALYFFKLYFNEGRRRHLLYFILLSCLSMVSIFSFLFPFAAMMIILVLRRFKDIFHSPVQILIIAISIPFVLYVADKGQIVSRCDPSIIGRDSLFRGGTISSLISYMSLMEFAPDRVFYILKALFSLTLLPVIYLVVKRKKWYIEITIVVVTLLLLVVAHYVMGAMYPVYRGVAYIIFLLLLSFAYSNFRRNLFFTIHFSAVILIGCVYMGYLFYFQSRNSAYDVVSYCLKAPGVLLVDENHMGAQADNHLYFHDALQIVTIDSEDSTVFENTLDTGKYVVCRPARLALSRSKEHFEPVFPVASIFYNNKVFYKRKSQ